MIQRQYPPRGSLSIKRGLGRVSREDRVTKRHCKKEMNTQTIIVALIIIAAAIYVVRSIYKSAKGHSCETGSCGCEPKVSKKIS
jgi:hypothetical protein